LRYTSADELADDLEAFLDNRPVAACEFRLSNLFVRRLRQETRFAPILHSAGREWMVHGCFLLVLCISLNLIQGLGVTAHWPFLLLLLGGGVAQPVVMAMAGLPQQRGPVTLIERHLIWMGWNAAIIWLGAFLLEWIHGLPVLALAPLLGVINCGMSLMLANFASGEYYRWAAAYLACAIAMVLIQFSPLPDFGLTLLGLVTWAAYFFPGRAAWKLQQQRLSIFDGKEKAA
jgi:hypothetical protein